MKFDARVPVEFGVWDDLTADDAVLLEADRLPEAGPPGISFQPGPGMLAAGCACCAPRGPLATALGDLFVARAKGDLPYFRRVLAVPATEAGRATMVAALTEDPVCSGRFRLA